MGDDDGRVCCILGVCCPPGSEGQRKALAEAISSVKQDAAGGLGERTYERLLADWVIDHFDLAPKDSLKDLKAMFAALVRR